MMLYLSIGTNQGDRKANIKSALEMLEKSFGCHWKALSDIIETPHVYPLLIVGVP